MYLLYKGEVSVIEKRTVWLKLAKGELIGMESLDNQPSAYDYKVNADKTLVFKFESKLFEDFDVEIKEFFCEMKQRKALILQKIKVERQELFAKIAKHINEQKIKRVRENEISVKPKMKKLIIMQGKSLLIGLRKQMVQPMKMNVKTIVESSFSTERAMKAKLMGKKKIDLRKMQVIKLIKRPNEEVKKKNKICMTERNTYDSGSFNLPLFSLER